MGRPDPGHEARTRRGLRDMAGGTLDGLLEIPAPISPSAGPIRISRLGPDRVPPEAETCLRPYDAYDGFAPHTSSHTVLSDGTVLASMVRGDEIRTARYSGGIGAFLDGDEDADSINVVESGLVSGGASSFGSIAPVATVSRAGGRTWMCASWVRRDVNADGDSEIVTRLLETTDEGQSWQTVTDLVRIVYDPDSLMTEFRLTPNAGKMLALASGRLVIMGARWYKRGSDWVANHWGVWTSDDGGNTWTLQSVFGNGPVGGPYTNSMCRNMTVFDGRLWAVTADDYGGINNRLRYSEDEGESWTTAWNHWGLPPFSSEDFFGMAPLSLGSTMIGFFRNFSTPSGLIHVATSNTPADFGSWTKIDEADCGEGYLDYQAYESDGRQWVEINGTLVTEYLPT